MFLLVGQHLSHALFIGSNSFLNPGNLDQSSEVFVPLCVLAVDINFNVTKTKTIFFLRFILILFPGCHSTEFNGQLNLNTNSENTHCYWGLVKRKDGSVDWKQPKQIPFKNTLEMSCFNSQQNCKPTFYKHFLKTHCWHKSWLSRVLWVCGAMIHSSQML